MKTKIANTSKKENLNFQNHKIDGYNYAIGPCRFLLRLLGAWPDFHYQRSWISFICILITIITMLLFCVISQSVKMFLSWRNFNLIIEILINCNIPTIIATTKIFSIWYHRYVLKDLLLQIIEDWKMVHVEQELIIMWTNARISRILCIGCIFMTQATLLCQCTVGIFNILSYISNMNPNDTMSKPLYMAGSFPYNVQVFPNYELSIFGQILSNIFASTSFSSVDSFFIVLMYHLIGQLSLLKLALFKLPNKIENAEDKKMFFDKFSLLHRRHNQLCRFSMSIEESFNMMFLIQMVPCFFGLCVLPYKLIQIISADYISIVELIFVVYFFLLFLFTNFLYCYIAELLHGKSIEVSYAVYNCNWTILPPKEARLFIFILLRTQIPFEITIGKFTTFSLQFYCHILKTSAGYLSMLLAVRNRMNY
ncbi:PREDICTED: odorant receptor 4 [Ceratosolen solmsi marchali]|uniref:Odorant receptor n=1 Tax=Ceratosolen solmsi marchali TaxID=326594 RepID=A0AAJ6YM00_9HYME|nr:PREDICTED: odorant receptor 4 [Ceratosolen solmsi marchali]